jgi:hypothetical protein
MFTFLFLAVLGFLGFELDLRLLGLYHLGYAPNPLLDKGLVHN